MIRTLLNLGLALICLLSGTVHPASAEMPFIVLTTLPATTSLTRSLSQNTVIDVANICPPGLRMEAQAGWFQEHTEELFPVFQKADAVVTIRHTWKQDYLYPYARAANIWIVEIDASTPPDPLMDGLPVLNTPVDSITTSGSQAETSVSPYIWMSLSNASTMAEFIAADLQRLVPRQAGMIRENLARLKQQLFQIKTNYELAFTAIEALEVVSLTDRCLYLTHDFNMYVWDYFLQDEYYWNTGNLDNFTSVLTQNAVKVVIHHREPGDHIRHTIRKAGATLVSLNTLSTFSGRAEEKEVEFYQHVMERNLHALVRAFKITE